MSIVDKEESILFDEFRNIISSQLSDSKTIPVVVHEIFDKFTTLNPSDNKTYLNFEGFENGFQSIKYTKSQLSKDNLSDIFNKIVASKPQSQKNEPNISIEELISFCQSTVSKARIVALKLRSCIVKEFGNSANSSYDDNQYEKVFETLKNIDDDCIHMKSFAEFVEDILNTNLSENDAINVFKLFDCDGDGKISFNDFLNFIIGRVPDVNKLLETGNPNVIVDIKVSNNLTQNADFIRIGYEQIVPSNEMIVSVLGNANAGNQLGTFAKYQSIWIWRKKQGTCNGRLRPILDIQVDNSSTSSALVLSGYTCINESISGQWLWIKRAFRLEDEFDGITDLSVTLGKMKNAGDKIWAAPSPVGWIRIDSNFSKGMMFTTYDAFLWFRPLRPRSIDAHMSSPIRSVVTLSDDARLTKFVATVRNVLRLHVPFNEMKKYASSSSNNANISDSQIFTNNSIVQFDFTTLFNKVRQVINVSIFSDIPNFNVV